MLQFHFNSKRSLLSLLTRLHIGCRCLCSRNCKHICWFRLATVDKSHCRRTANDFLSLFLSLYFYYFAELAFGMCWQSPFTASNFCWNRAANMFTLINLSLKHLRHKDFGLSENQAIWGPAHTKHSPFWNIKYTLRFQVKIGHFVRSK